MRLGVAVVVRWAATATVVAALVLAACTHGRSANADAGVCVDFELTDNDLACGTVNDCTVVVTGILCANDPCGCVGTPVTANVAAGERFTIQTVALPNAECGTEGSCTETLELLCVNSKCVSCNIAPGADSCSVDSGVPDSGED